MRFSGRRWAPAGLIALAGLVGGCSGGAAESTGPGASASATSSATTGSTTSSSATPQETYGGYPTFLPSDTVTDGFSHRVVDASAERPALATQGDTVRVHVGAASVLVTVTGPAVPVEGQQYQAPASPATWQVVLRHASTSLPLDPATFQAIDEEGAVHDLQPQGSIPTAVRPGQTVEFVLFSPAFTTGEGRMRWIPVGHLAPVEWDFVVETD